MNRISKLRTLTRSQKKLLLDALLRVALARAGLWVLGLDKTRVLVARPKKREHREPLERVVWAVHAASRLVPRASCLVQAIALQTLLSGQGHASQLMIGVAMGEKFQAHAWVEYKGKVLIGDTPGARYEQLLSLECLA